MTTIKICFVNNNNDLHRIRIGSNTKEIQFHQLIHTLSEMYPSDFNKNNVQGYFFYYIDNEGDQITISNTQDLQEGLEIMQGSNLTFKIMIAKRTSGTTVHCTTSEHEVDQMEVIITKSLEFLDSWTSPRHYTSLTEEIKAIFREATARRNLAKVASQHQFLNIFKESYGRIQKYDVFGAIHILLTSDQLPLILSQFVQLNPKHQKLVVEILNHLNKYQNEKIAATEMLTDTMDINMVFELVTGSRNPDFKSLADDVICEILVNIGIPVSELQAMSRSKLLQSIETLISCTPPKNLSDPQEDAEQTNIHLKEEAKPNISSQVELFAGFVEDLTLSDGSMVPPNKTCIKTWKLTNTGAQSWPIGTMLKQIDTNDTVLEGYSVEVAPIKPNETTEVTLTLLAPAESIRWVTYWRLFTPNNIGFGDKLWNDVVVDTTDLPLKSSPKKSTSASTAEATTEDSRSIDVNSIDISLNNKWKKSIEELNAMGFSDLTLVTGLLEKNSGNMQLVIDELLTQ